MQIAAIVTGYDREDAIRETIRNLQRCNPPPKEILVHLDGGVDMILPSGVRILRSQKNVGPGGGRNFLIRESSCDWVASFDDDSYPVSTDFFANLDQVIRRHPEAGVIAMTIRHRNSIHDSNTVDGDCEVASFVGCGCAYRKEAFLRTRGYTPLPIAYGMEEVDLALQLHDLNLSIIESPELEVFHDTDLSHHQAAKITAGAIVNQALLVWLRYPRVFWPRGALQYFNKVFDSITRRRWKGVFLGIIRTPGHLFKYRQFREPVSRKSLRIYFELQSS